MNNATLNSITLNGYPGGAPSSAYGDFPCSIVTSDYKWLSKSLKLAQQQFAVRPYYTCQIIDDSLVPNQILTSPNQPKQGSAVTAPDGTILAVGLDSSNNVGFWKIADASNTALWLAAPNVILENNVNNRSSKNHYAIQVSEYIAGTYKIDVYFFGSFNAGVLSIVHYHSLDGGVTWASNQLVNNTNIPYNSTQNISLAAGKPYQDNNGNIISTVFYTQLDTGLTPNYDILYQQYPGTGTNFGTNTFWTTKNVDTKDWIIHSIDVAYIKGYWYVVFSGYHVIYEQTNANSNVLNYNIYITKIVNFTNNINTDVWTAASEIISALSSSTQNLNSFTLPQITYNSKMMYVVFSGMTVTSIVDSNGGNNVLTTTNYYMTQSVDFLNFTYPQPIIFLNGTEFTDTYSYSFVFQNNLAYLVGNGQLWQYIQNNTVADVTNDILSYKLNDSQQNPSTVDMFIGNQNNQWRGASPTKSGYQAIAANKKINIMQGYYNASGLPEVAPRNIYYIDDILANVNANTNDFELQARDLYKPLQVLTTKYAFNYLGIKKYIDIFDGTTLGNYNIISGSWGENNNELQMLASGTLIFSLYQQTKANVIMSLTTDVIATSGVQTYIYLYYVDENNFMRFTLDGSTFHYQWKTETNRNGTISTLQSGTFPFPGNGLPIPFLFIKHNYYKWDIYMGDNTNSGKNIDCFNNPTFLDTLDMTFDIETYFREVGSVGFGNNNQVQGLQNFKYIEFDSSENIEELVQAIATKAGIFDYKLPNIFQDYLCSSSNYNGTFTIKNRSMFLPPSNTSMKIDSQYSNIEIKFTGKLDIANPSVDFSFDFIFRNTGFSSQNENYFIRFIDETPSGGVRAVRLYGTHLGGQYQLAGTNLVVNSTNNGVNFDFTQSHEYRVLFFNGYIFVMIDGIVVLGWFDNNVTNTPTTGYIGFRTDSNTQLEAKNIVGIDLWNQIETYSLNPGDDLETSVETLLTTLRVYFFSDLFGRLKILRLNSTDPAGYTYENQLILQQLDNSSKEYVNQVTVIGYNNITATAKDGASISITGTVREEVINDNKITTYSDALARAQAELTSFNKFNSQFNPKQILNVGSELYDVIHVINTGPNSSNVDQVVRNYSQEIDVGGNNLDYWIELGTGVE